LKKLQSDGRAIAKRSRSNCKTLAGKLQSDGEAIAKLYAIIRRFYNNFKAIDITDTKVTDVSMLGKVHRLF
jgi:hypothetical protein